LCAAVAFSWRWARAPQCWQWRLPWKLRPKHEGQAMVASRDLQKRQFGASVETAAPHEGQFNVAVFINLVVKKGGKREGKDDNENLALKVCHIYAAWGEFFFGGIAGQKCCLLRRAPSAFVAALYCGLISFFNDRKLKFFNPQSAIRNPQSYDSTD
jgi:hypothetical protein